MAMVRSARKRANRRSAAVVANTPIPARVAASLNLLFADCLKAEARASGMVEAAGASIRRDIEYGSKPLTVLRDVLVSGDIAQLELVTQRLATRVADAEESAVVENWRRSARTFDGTLAEGIASMVGSPYVAVVYCTGYLEAVAEIPAFDGREVRTVATDQVFHREVLIVDAQKQSWRFGRELYPPLVIRNLAHDDAAHEADAEIISSEAAPQSDGEAIVLRITVEPKMQSVRSIQ